MYDREQHNQEVQRFLQKHVASQPWELALPEGHGGETYTARCEGQACFVKLTPHAARYEVMASLGLTPPVLAAGTLADGASILIQSAVDGHAPTPRELRSQMRHCAEAVRLMHQSPRLRAMLPGGYSSLFSDSALRALELVRGRWQQFRSAVPEVVPFVDASLDALEQEARKLVGSGSVASHNDICNANWLLTGEGRLYLVDLDQMAVDDPAVDLGALLWWYYPPKEREGFLEAAGYASEPGMTERMRVRMAIHCLNIELPRPHSFDAFDPSTFPKDLVDFRAVMANEQNPQGYGD
jgi:thiamine kinase-like enzyme